jgi:hypothetical protein
MSFCKNSREKTMTTQELEQQLLSLDSSEKLRMIQLLAQSLIANPDGATSSPPQSEASLVEFFRRSPLCEVADEIDLSRDQRVVSDRVVL